MNTTSSGIIYKTLIENIDEAVWMWDKNEKTIYANPKFCKLLWYTLEEILGKESYEFRNQESSNRVKKENTHKRKKWESSSYEWIMVTKSWKEIPVTTNGTNLPWWGTMGIMTDVSKLKEKERSEKILVQAVQYSTDAIILFNNNWEILSWNKWAKIIFGHVSESIIWKNISNIFYKKDMEKLLSQPEILYKHELKAKHKNKNTLTISSTITPIRDTNLVDDDSFLLVCRDITNRRKIEEEIDLKYLKIREVYKQIGSLKRQNDYIFDLLQVYQDYHYDVKSLWNFIVTSIIMLTQVDGCVFRVYDEEKKTLKMISNFWLADSWEGIKSIKFKNSLAEKAFQSNKMLKVLDVSNEPLYHSPALARKANMSSMLLIPLQSKWKIVGTLTLYTQADRNLEIFENEFIEKYAKVVEVVVESSI